MMNLRVIKNTDEYSFAIEEIEKLMELDPPSGTPDGERLELLSVLVEDFEKRQAHFTSPDPISAIEFRMNEQGLQQRDLVPLLGSRSRVSEVLSGKRSLTVPMIRALSSGLGISAEVLVGKSQQAKNAALGAEADVKEEVEWTRFPIKEMQKRGWIAAPTKSRNIESILKEFFSHTSSDHVSAFYRRRLQGEGFAEKARYSILAWTARVLLQARTASASDAPFEPSSLSPQIIQELVRLSWFDEGPKLAMRLLAKHGITVVIEPKLPNTQLDGAALLTESKQAVIGLTLRYDRVDWFWFTLLHEVAHVWKHLSTSEEAFVDRLEASESNDYREKEANRFARESLIPRAIWRRSRAFLSPNRENILNLADDLRIHPAIVVGRLHFETKNYRAFTDLLRAGTVRKLFSDKRFE